VDITVSDDPGLFDACSAEWGELLRDSDANQIFLTSDWQSLWWEAYHPGRLWTLVLRDASGRWIGAAPWFIERNGYGERVVRTVGCVDVTDYLDIIARRGYEAQVFDALARWLAAHRAEFDVARLCNIPQRSPALAQFPAAVAAHGLSVGVRLQEVCPVVQLPATFAEYVAGLDKHNRHELRRKLRRAAGHYEWYVVGEEHDLGAELARFLRLMAASSPEKARFLDDPANRRFFEIMVPRMAARGWLELAFLTIRGEAAAAYLNFDYANHILVYNSGHDPEVGAGYSPGILLLARLIERAIAEGREAFDFLRGDEPYKYDMGGRDTNIYQIVIGEAGLPALNQD